MKQGKLFLVFLALTLVPFWAAQAQVPGDMVLIKGGTFTMGSPTSEAEREDNEVQHRVLVGDFYLGRYEVTQKEYHALMGTNPSEFKDDNLPVENVSWYDAIEYCNARSQKEGLSPAYTIDKSQADPNNQNQNPFQRDELKWRVTWNPQANGYRLPTEAEWEYACRAGTVTPFSTGNNITTNQADYDGNYPYNGNAEGTYREETTAVGSFAANPWGVYDTHGNVYEWCWDWYGDYSAGAQTDPQGAPSGSYRVIRSGSWNGIGRSLRSADRDGDTPSNRYSTIGFRVLRPSS
jgi:formylglycine-generating enzyme required for sulfatase activity